jgi:hypothetical protein
VYRVAGFARHNMEMQVRHQLAGASLVVGYDVKPFRTGFLKYRRISPVTPTAPCSLLFNCISGRSFREITSPSGY